MSAQENHLPQPQPPQKNELSQPPQENHGPAPPQKYVATITVMFTKFGGRKYHLYDPMLNSLDANEKVKLMTAVWDAADATAIVQEAAKFNVDGHHDKLKLCFGIDQEQVDFNNNVQIIKNGINKRHALLTAPTQLINFVDGRGKLINNKKIITENALGIYPCTEKCNISKPHLKDTIMLTIPSPLCSCFTAMDQA